MYDFDAILARVNLRKLITADIGPPDAFGRFDCPFCGDGPERPPWCGDEPSLSVRPDGRSFHCRDCKAWGNALDWLARRMNIGVLEAARKLVPNLEVFRISGAQRTRPTGQRESSHAHSVPRTRSLDRPCDSEIAWEARACRLANANIRVSGLSTGDAWAQARGVVAELRATANPEAAWRDYLDANPLLQANTAKASRQRPRSAS